MRGNNNGMKTIWPSGLALLLVTALSLLGALGVFVDFLRGRFHDLAFALYCAHALSAPGVMGAEDRNQSWT